MKAASSLGTCPSFATKLLFDVSLAICHRQIRNSMSEPSKSRVRIRKEMIHKTREKFTFLKAWAWEVDSGLSPLLRVIPEGSLFSTLFLLHIPTNFISVSVRQEHCIIPNHGRRYRNGWKLCRPVWAQQPASIAVVIQDLVQLQSPSLNLL